MGSKSAWIASGIYVSQSFVTRTSAAFVWIGRTPGMTGTVVPCAGLVREQVSSVGAHRTRARIFCKHRRKSRRNLAKSKQITLSGGWKQEKSIRITLFDAPDHIIDPPNHAFAHTLWRWRPSGDPHPCLARNPSRYSVTWAQQGFKSHPRHPHFSFLLRTRQCIIRLRFNH